ncbi:MULTISPECIES: radical SAM protein [unclassified Clostridioides]|uniref:radical SAM protein n=1 Tax=unclassified Clostridioides TaxID=2635829 RepID=UPI001D0C72C3|nr:radical SAM protein [Clostridioides sp. ES-S-0001-02]MCC0640789.1 radical SAM protein [Clostridioides sp. ES-S-0049-03]MCC0653331.1 radical SAM protein [Clostridioides sp. ES-S-0001-03]MCC0656660.1 radical SAM protein [Clostridioides sp. ES-S-0123-01]MCC0672051.1 radical SAM protein [Clostridioides sp. ES-S-0145-01]MCC0676041.1 radical SAM protein [Clostridioides sp. ES-W-0018-02]MCC0681372.1 radical SAM protein [Clostridioides sp. ES-S-0005-03]MCC0695650.1 radical SAM protein [Clostridio
MIRLSSGTAIELGILNKKSDIPPTTAYIMIGEKCINKCSFCSQSIESSTRKDKLSRVVWPEYSKEEILNALRAYNGKNIKRICIQSMASEEAHKSVLDFINYINGKIDMPISLSAKLESDEEINKFFSAGVDKIGIAIDAASKDLYEKIKGYNYDEKLNFITKMSKLYPNKISTHIIVGMGESHEDIYNLYTYLKKNNITISLFAFTPVRGTKMEKISQPNIESYRRVQLMSYMINKGYSQEYFEFKNGYLENIKLDDETVSDINRGYPFEIRGCKDCNRPYYNERPGSTIYNYSRPLNQDEIDLAIRELNL